MLEAPVEKSIVVSHLSRVERKSWVSVSETKAYESSFDSQSACHLQRSLKIWETLTQRQCAMEKLSKEVISRVTRRKEQVVDQAMRVVDQSTQVVDQATLEKPHKLVGHSKFLAIKYTLCGEIASG